MYAVVAQHVAALPIKPKLTAAADRIIPAGIAGELQLHGPSSCMAAGTYQCHRQRPVPLAPFTSVVEFISFNWCLLTAVAATGCCKYAISTRYVLKGFQLLHSFLGAADPAVMAAVGRPKDRVHHELRAAFDGRPYGEDRMHVSFFIQKIQPWIITQPRADISFLSDRTIWSPPKATMSFIGPRRHRLTAKAGHTSCIRLRADSPGHLPNTSSRVRMSDEGGGCDWNKHRRDAAGSWRHTVF